MIISEAASLSQMYTNHSVRETAITLLSEAGMQNRHITAISSHSNEQSFVSYNKKPAEGQLMKCSNIILPSLNFRVPFSHFMNTQSQPRQDFPVNQMRADVYVQLQGMFNSCNIGSTNVILK